MSKTTVKINRIKRKLDNISGLDGYFVQDRLDKIEKASRRNRQARR